jgi:hypothetical protein
MIIKYMYQMFLNGFSHFYFSVGTFNLTRTTTQRFKFGLRECHVNNLNNLEEL